MPIIQTLCVYVSKGARFRGYFSKPKGVREQKGLGNTAPDYTRVSPDGGSKTTFRISVF